MTIMTKRGRPALAIYNEPDDLRLDAGQIILPRRGAEGDILKSLELVFLDESASILDLAHPSKPFITHFAWGFTTRPWLWARSAEKWLDYPNIVAKDSHR
jgi:hypothetical protein